MVSPLVENGVLTQRIEKKIPNEVQIPQYPTFSITSHTAKVMEIIEKEFSDHHGTMDKFNFATNHDQVSDLLDFFFRIKIT